MPARSSVAPGRSRYGPTGRRSPKSDLDVLRIGIEAIANERSTVYRACNTSHAFFSGTCRLRCCTAGSPRRPASSALAVVERAAATCAATRSGTGDARAARGALASRVRRSPVVDDAARGEDPRRRPVPRAAQERRSLPGGLPPGRPPHDPAAGALGARRTGPRVRLADRDHALHGAPPPGG